MTDIPYDSMRQRLADQRILLVGGAGFIGHNLALELARLGAAVMVVDNLCSTAWSTASMCANAIPFSARPTRRFCSIASR